MGVIKKTPLSDKRELFCQEYLKDFNATRAAKDAGYSQKTAYSQGQRLLKAVEIQARLGQLLKKPLETNEVTVERVLREMARIAFLDPSKLYDKDGNPIPVQDLDEDTRRAIGSLEVNTTNTDTGPISVVTKVRLIDKKGGLEMLGKYLKMFTDSMEITGKDGGPIQFRDLSDEELEDKIRGLNEK